MNNKKKIFLKILKENKLKEAVVEPGLTIAGKWPGVHPMDRAKGLAQRGMERAASGEVPPWEPTEPERQYAAPSGNSVTDEDVIRSIYNLLKDNQSPGYRVLAGRFMEMMKERGVISQEAGDKIDKGHKVRSARMAGFNKDLDIDADEMEASLGRLRAVDPDEER